MPAMTNRATAALAACLIAGLAAPAVGSAAKDDLVLVSLPTLLSDPPSTGTSEDAAVSSNGRIVAFESTGDSLSQEDNDTFDNIFIRNVDTNVTTLINRQTGTAAASAGANATSSDPSISGDARLVAFSSSATNLATDDTTTIDLDVFVRDTVTNTTTLISRATGSPGAPGNGNSGAPAISRDGRFVAFASAADNFSNEENEAVDNIFVRDLTTNTTTLVSRGAAGAADDTSSQPAISADGRYVAFLSSADNLSTEDNDAFINVFVRDLVAGTTTLISRAPGAAGAAADNAVDQPSISDDGTQVAFATGATNLSTDDSDSALDVFVRNWAAETTTLVSRASGPAGTVGGASSFNAAISGDGKHVVFASDADEFSPDDNNSALNVFVRDLTKAITTLVSRGSGPTGAATAADSRDPEINRDGRFVAFESADAGLSALDHDPATDVFLRDLVGDVVADPPPSTVGAPPAGAATPATPVVPIAAAPNVTLASLLTAPTTKRCVSKRKLTLRLKNANQITKLTVKVSGVKKTTTVRGTKLRAAINLTGLPRGRYTVTVTATLRDGTTQKVTRTYRTCTPKKR